MPDMPDPCQSSISSRAFSNTGCGKTAGPALKLNTLATVAPLTEIRVNARGIDIVIRYYPGRTDDLQHPGPYLHRQARQPHPELPRDLRYRRFFAIRPVSLPARD